MAKSFNQAFREARASGLDKFEWNGKWYGTKYATETNAQSVSHVEKGKGQQKYATSDSKSKDRYVIKKVNGNQYGIFDKRDGYFVGRAFNSAEEAQKYGNSDQFKQDTGELVVTASGKINSNTAGYVPIQGIGLVDRNGNTRVYKNYETGQKVVTDNYGNKVGDSYDPNAEKAGFGGWVINTGSQQDIRRGQAGQARNQANIRETNQKAQQEKDRKMDERAFQIRGIQDMQGMANLAQGAANLPNHAIIGALKLARNDYGLNDYLEGFTLDGTWNGKQQVGLGDLLEVQNPYGRIATNFINPLSLIGSSPRVERIKGKPIKTTLKTHNLDAHPTTVRDGSAVDLQTVTVRNSQNGQFSGYAHSEKWPISNGTRTKNGKFSVVRSDRPQMTSTGQGASIQPQSSSQFLNKPLYSTTYNTTPRPSTITVTTPGATSTVLTSNGVYPFNAIFGKDYVNYARETDKEIPTANFYYDSSEYNPTVMGRIQTGDFVPGTVGPNWNGGINGGQVRVNNRKNAGYTFPAFGGKTAGNGRDNETNRYLRSGYTR